MTAGARSLISVIVPAYNAEAFLAESMRSILTQTHQNLELIVVDDGSVDGTAEVARSFGDPRIRLISQPNGGESVARNTGLAAATGDFIAWQDADDVSLPNRLETMLTALERSAAAFAHCDMVLIDGTGQPLGLWQSSNVIAGRVLPFFLRVGTPYNNPSMLIRTDAIDGLKFVPGLRIGADTEFMLQFASRFDGLHIPEPLMMYRRHGSNITAGASANDVGEHVRLILSQYRLERFVPEAWISRDRADATSVAACLVALRLSRRGFIDQAAEWIAKAVGDQKGGSLSATALSIANLAAGNHAAALTALGGSQASDPVAVNYLGELQVWRGDHAGAFRSFRAALDLAPAYEEPVINLTALGGARGLNLVNPNSQRFAGMPQPAGPTPPVNVPSLVHFWIPTYPDASFSSWQPDADPGRYPSGVGHAILELYKRLEASGAALSIGPVVPPSVPTVVAHLESFNGWDGAQTVFDEVVAKNFTAQIGPEHKVVVIRGDVPTRSKLPLADALEIVPHPQAADGPNKAWLPFLPQRGLIPRDRARLGAAKTVAIFAYAENVPDVYRSDEWLAAVGELGMTVVANLYDYDDRRPPQWHDFSAVDVLLCARHDVHYRELQRKPPTKMINAWVAGAIPLIGANEIGCMTLARPDVDCLVADSPESTIAALARLADTDLIRRLEEGGRERATEFSVERISAQWGSLLGAVA